MDDLIHRQDVSGALTMECSWIIYDEYGQLTPNGKEILGTLKKIPSVDAVEVVRCHKCVHWDEDTVRRNSNDATWWNEAVCRKYSDDIWEVWKDADWFCADGERKDNE